MPIQYIKRYQMAFDLTKQNLPTAVLPGDFIWVPWKESLAEAHARVKYESFCNDMDGSLFPSFSTLEGCRRLMDVITSRSGFLPGTTWLIAYAPNPQDNPVYCATIQGIRHSPESGGIQNVAVAPNFRRRGLGEVLVRKALHGFRQAGVKKVALEVTAENTTAVNLYLRIGFQMLQTVYKESSVSRPWSLKK